MNLEVRNLPPCGACIEYIKGIATPMVYIRSSNIYEGRSSFNIRNIALEYMYMLE